MLDLSSLRGLTPEDAMFTRRLSVVFIVNFEHILHLNLVFLLLTLNI